MHNIGLFCVCLFFFVWAPKDEDPYDNNLWVLISWLIWDYPVLKYYRGYNSNALEAEWNRIFIKVLMIISSTIILAYVLIYLE